MRLTVSLLTGALVLGAIGQGTFAQQQAPPAQARPTAAPARSPEQVAAFRAFAALTSDPLRQSFYDATPPLRDPGAAAAYSAWVRDAQLPGPERVTAYSSLEWLARLTGAQRQIVIAHSNRGSAYGSMGRYDLAKVDLEQAHALVGALNDDVLRASVLTSLATALGRLGDSGRALTLFNEAAEVALALNDTTAQSRALNNLGNYYFVRGDLRRAQDAFTRVLNLSPDDGAAGTLARARALGNIGGLYLDAGDLPQAIRLFEDAIALWSKSSVRASAASLLVNLAYAHRESDRSKARAYLERARAEAETFAEAHVAANVQHILGLIAFDERRWNDAKASFQRAATMHENGSNWVGVADALSQLADVALIQSDPDGAEPSLIRARDLAATAGVVPAVIRAQVGLGAVAELRKDTKRALALYQEAEGLLESLSLQAIGSERTQQQFLAYRLAPYLGAAAVHATDGRYMDALLASERARSRVLLGVIDRGVAATTQMSEAERTRESDLTAAVAIANETLRLERGKQKPDADRVGELEAAVTKARLTRDAFLDGLYAAKPAVGLARGRPTMATPAAIASLLPKGTGAVLFVMEPIRVWRYIVTTEKGMLQVRADKLAIEAPDLRKMAEQFAGQVASRDLAFASSSRKLREVLFTGVEPALEGFDHVIVVPDGPLWQVPFQALQDQTGRYLIQRSAVSYAPSLSALAALETRKAGRPRRGTRLVALGDPLVNAESARLPEAAREVRALGNVYGANNSVVLTGTDATEDAIRTHARGASVVHIATHGDLDNSTPMYSFLRLAPTALRDTRRDGRLEAVEWMDLDIAADLVVLSACTTAGAPALSGEGLIGQTWALFAAGASSAVVSQWAVDSASTTDLMIAFHQRYKATGARAVGPAAALRDAAQKVMADPKYRHPFYWAAFSVVGVR